jgi:uroporphyrinogen decarboxylase
MEACIAGKPVDRPPVALWRHFPVDDQAPGTLAAATLEWQSRYDWDLVKVTPASSFCLKDWGVDDTWEGSAEGTRRYNKRIVATPEDWTRLQALAPDSPHLASQLKCLSLLRAELGPDIPLIQTIFAPLAQAKNLVGGEALIAHLRQNPDLVKRGLSVIAETTRSFIEAARKTGVDGVFYAVQHAQAQLLTEEEFTEFGIAYDLPVLESASPLWLNMLHIHGENIYFDLVADYPVQVINWHDRDTAPSLADARSRTSSTLCGGLRRETMVYGTAEDISREAENALEQTGGGKFVLGTGCVVEIIAPHGNLIAARKAVER